MDKANNNTRNNIEILYDNDEIYVINKPSGLAVQGGQGISHSLDVDFSEQVGQKIYLVHRLDKETRGLMIVAKTPQAASKWTKMIASKQVQKQYTALCFGTLKKKKGVINDSVVQHGEMKTAVTSYQIVDESEITLGEEKIPVSMIQLDLQTGRMHQIRIHLSKNECPIMADDNHGNFKLNKLLKKEYKIKSLQLCSSRLSLPVNGKNVVFEIDGGNELIHF